MNANELVVVLHISRLTVDGKYKEAAQYIVENSPPDRIADHLCSTIGVAGYDNNPQAVQAILKEHGSLLSTQVLRRLAAHPTLAQHEALIQEILRKKK